MTSDAPTEAPAFARAFEHRAERAEQLRAGSLSGAGPLAFAAELCRAQGACAAALAVLHAARAFSGRLETDAARLVPPGRIVLRCAEAYGPPELSQRAHARLAEDATAAGLRLELHGRGDSPADGDYLSRALLRPYLELLRSLGVRPQRETGRGRCPFCGGRPWLGALRGGSSSEGAQRSLACSACGGEWSTGRILCPSCFEEDPRRLPVFTSDSHPGVRVCACETCRHYLKELDLSQDARPIPEIDDLASLALDLWAGERGFARIEPGLAGI